LIINFYGLILDQYELMAIVAVAAFLFAASLVGTNIRIAYERSPADIASQ
jgi:hypothetical protein